MEKLLTLLLLGLSTLAVANRNFTICYFNDSEHAIAYNNDIDHHNWESSGELTGNGKIAVNENKCFTKVNDETVFAKDYIIFSVNNKWTGIVNGGFTNPYIVAQGSKGFIGGNLYDNSTSGIDTYTLNIFVLNHDVTIYTNSNDVTDKSHWIKPVQI